MKKLNLLFLTFILIFTLQLNAQEIEVLETQHPMVMKKTANWCPPCGGWGWDLFADIITDNSEKAWCVSAQFSPSDPLYSETAKAIADNFGSFSQPRFFYNGVDQDATSSNAADVRSTISTKVNTDVQLSPLAQSGILAAQHNGMLEVHTKVKFFDTADGEYFIAVYLVEKEKSATQSGQSGSVQHKYVLREQVFGGSFGELLVSGNISENDEFIKMYSKSLDGYSLSNLQIVAVIWKRNGTSYEFVNSTFTEEITAGPIASVDYKFLDRHFMISPNLTQNLALASFKLPESVNDLSLSIFDQNGRLIKTIFSGDLPAGSHHIELNRSDIFSAGLYFVRLQAENQVWTRRVVFQ